LVAAGTDELARELQRTGDLLKAARAMASAGDLPPAERVAALSVLVRSPDPADVGPETLERLASWVADARSPVEVQRAALRALVVAPSEATPAVLVGKCDSLGPGLRTAVLDELLGREAWTIALLTAIEQGRVAASGLDATRRARVARHPSARVREIAARVVSTGPSGDRARVIAEFAPALDRKGDPANGRLVFLVRCASCHRAGDAGNDIGPDLKSVTAHEPARLLAAILDPNADVQPGFQAYQCRLATGEELYGLITSETAASLQLKLTDGTTRAVLRSEIDSIACLNASLMPEGLEAGMSVQEMADLIAHLRSR
jgi:putative heme-binding domain-containing protein